MHYKLAVFTILRPLCKLCQERLFHLSSQLIVAPVDALAVSPLISPFLQQSPTSSIPETSRYLSHRPVHTHLPHLGLGASRRTDAAIVGTAENRSWRRPHVS